mgnify:CR=1 FL=1
MEKCCSYCKWPQKYGLIKSTKYTFGLESKKISKMDGLITAQEAANILGCTRPHIDNLVRKNKLMPISTIYPRLYFDKDEVLLLKEIKSIYGSNKK